MQKMLEEYKNVRQKSCELTKSIELGQVDLQVNCEVSPIKWHLGHTTWFYEYFLLKEFPDYDFYHPDYLKLFNSYYKGAGEHIEQGRRGEKVWTSLEDVLLYREKIDCEMLEKIKEFDEQKKLLLTIGLQHEKQHQELILMDVLRTYFESGCVYDESSPLKFEKSSLEMHLFEGGLFEAGVNYSAENFCYDNETPKHKVFLAPFKMANRLVSNEEYQEFIAEDGYKNPAFWLSDGWKWICENKINAPLYWSGDNEFSLHGFHKRDPYAPVRHISYYEAQAFARFKNKRLPSEYEWEYAVQNANFSDLQKTLWQWTQSAYLPYPGYKWQKDILGEYNGKFMVNQMVLRGGAFTSPENHLRITYRNFFYPHQRWAFTGLRLAEDL